MQKKQPKFKVGDVVEDCTRVKYSRHKGEFNYQIKKALFETRQGFRGIVIEYWRGTSDKYDVYWFDNGSIEPRVHSNWIKRCSGLRNKKLCNECGHNDFCNIARCDISEFAQLRGEGKYNPDVCKQRQCKYLGRCLTTRFIQKKE
jgi:hypothetical protein